MDSEILAQNILDNLELNGILKENYDRAMALNLIELSLEEEIAYAEEGEAEEFADVDEVLRRHFDDDPNDDNPDEYWSVG